MCTDLLWKETENSPKNIGQEKLNWKDAGENLSLCLLFEIQFGVLTFPDVLQVYQHVFPEWAVGDGAGTETMPFDAFGVSVSLIQEAWH